MKGCCCGDTHLWIQQTSLWLHDRNGLVVGLERIGLACAVKNDGTEVQAHIGRLQVRHEGIAQALLLAGRDLHVVFGRRQVLDDARRLTTRGLDRPERAPDKGHRHGPGLAVLDRQRALRLAAVDDLDAEDLGLRERGFDGHVQ